MANFKEYPQDNFRPEYGGVSWTHRLNALLEATGVELVPVGYEETEPMQVTQENTIVYINQIADELDCIAVKYDLDPEEVWTFYFRENFANSPVPFEHVAQVVGAWATNITTLYPMQHIVERYEAFSAQDLDHIPEDWA